MSKSQQKRLAIQRDHIHKTAEAACEYLRGQISHAGEIDAQDADTVAAIIRRTLREAVPEQDESGGNHFDSKDYEHGWNACLKAMGVSE